MWKLSQDEARSLELVVIWFDMNKKKKTRKMGTYNWNKMNIASGKWKEPRMVERQLTKPAEAAYDWLMTNETYASWQLAAMTAGPHKDHGYVFQTWNLLHSPGIEVAAFPLLYPQRSFGDANLKDRLMEKNWNGANAKPSMAI